MSLILNLDCSLQDASVSISRNGEIVSASVNIVQKDHSAFLHVAIRELLKTNRLQPTELDAIACAIGPGSYTGLRVCLAAAKGLCYALDKPLIGVGTLNAMAEAAISQNKTSKNSLFCPLIHARRMEVYTALYNADKEEITAPHAKILTRASFETELKSKKIFFFGSGAEKWKGICINANAFFTGNGNIMSALSLLAYKKFSAGNFSDISMTVPLYTKEFFINKES